jgi:serine phosphatase RsbU (regulator of sigma subunit)
LFSDGYPDQIGGEHQKKFYYSSFQELLGSIYTLPTLEQKSKINEALVQWMNGREQIDDISILGMKF